MKKITAIAFLCLFGLYGALQGQAHADEKFGHETRVLLSSPAPTSADVTDGAGTK